MEETNTLDDLFADGNHFFTKEELEKLNKEHLEIPRILKELEQKKTDLEYRDYEIRNIINAVYGLKKTEKAAKEGKLWSVRDNDPQYFYVDRLLLSEENKKGKNYKKIIILDQNSDFQPSMHETCKECGKETPVLMKYYFEYNMFDGKTYHKEAFYICCEKWTTLGLVYGYPHCPV